MFTVHTLSYFKSSKAIVMERFDEEYFCFLFDLILRSDGCKYSLYEITERVEVDLNAKK